jgi:hypothetical protein
MNTNDKKQSFLTVKSFSIWVFAGVCFQFFWSILIFTVVVSNKARNNEAWQVKCENESVCMEIDENCVKSHQKFDNSMLKWNLFAIISNLFPLFSTLSYWRYVNKRVASCSTQSSTEDIESDVSKANYTHTAFRFLLGIVIMVVQETVVFSNVSFENEFNCPPSATNGTQFAENYYQSVNSTFPCESSMAPAQKWFWTSVRVFNGILSATILPNIHALWRNSTVENRLRYICGGLLSLLIAAILIIVFGFKDLVIQILPFI